MEISAKILLVLSIIFMGYSISELLSGFKSFSEKTAEFKDLIKFQDAPNSTLRLSNLLMSLGLAACYIYLIWKNEYANWIIALATFKLAVSLYCSDFLLVKVLKNENLTSKNFFFSKLDSFFNAVLALFIALFLVL